MEIKQDVVGALNDGRICYFVKAGKQLNVLSRKCHSYVEIRENIHAERQVTVDDISISLGPLLSFTNVSGSPPPFGVLPRISTC